MRKALTVLVMAGALASTLITTAASAAPSDKVVMADNFPTPGQGQGKGQGSENGNGWGVGGTPPSASPH
jgi:Spy/CpxP family protein refolding chaperone